MMKSLLLLLVALSAVRGRLSPLILWSNSDVLNNLKANNGLDAIKSTLTDNGGDIDVVIVFTSGELSFDDIAKHGSVFANKGSSGKLNSLKSSIELSTSQYWTGIHASSLDWAWDLASNMGKQARVIDKTDLINSNDIQGVMFVDLKEYADLKFQDDAVGHVMDTIQRSGKSFVAILAEQATSTEKNFVQNQSIREIDVVKNSRVTMENSSNCAIGGVLYDSYNSPCILLCLGMGITFYPSTSNDSSYCVLNYPSNITHCCQNQECNSTYAPSATVMFIVDNTSSTGNTCTKDLFEGFPTLPDKPKFNDNTVIQTLELSLVLKFVNTTASSWLLAMDVMVSYVSEVQEDEPDDGGPDDKNDDGGPDDKNDDKGPDDENDNENVDNRYKDDGDGDNGDGDNGDNGDNGDGDNGDNGENGNDNDNDDENGDDNADNGDNGGPDDGGGPDEEDDTFTVTDMYYNLVRVVSGPLYVSFGVPMGLSYACSAGSYSNFNSTSYNNGNWTNASIVLQGIQVQPYQVSSTSFASSDNCIGYFSAASWMGILSGIIIVLMLYTATVFAFSMNTLDAFEDPRGKTISVDKLH